MNEKPMLVLGTMSGTSADGIDVALARISGAPPHLNAKLLGHTSVKFAPALRKEILRVAEQHPITAGTLSQLNFRLGELFADAALAASSGLHQGKSPSLAATARRFSTKASPSTI